ncbi:Transcriptional regulator, AraC-family [Devosia sp. LC5]|uniref:helix-turn-helix domain-containing protein n=1 Tax=Devosia sp. LC5 TaxID=1502724 RepID=UPI0004E2B3F0|nr:helix-turn-helix domain-containing protein [Devosia sp. LC5]KFC62451.1 Transcriptional regulator, AraC-family [Devosia sp. LC5]
MIIIGQMVGIGGTQIAKSRTKLDQLNYRPSGRDLDVEIFHFSDLRRRVSSEQILALYRYSFHTLICVTEGAVTQVVDFQPVSCSAGSLLVLRPGQVHSFGSDEGWDGWMVLFRAEFLPSETQATADLLPVLGLDRLPDHLSLSTADFAAVNEAIARMQQDATSAAPSKDLHALLRYELCVLLLRLAILQDQHLDVDVTRSPRLQRYGRFRRLLEQNYAGWHQVSDYAAALGCTEKSLTRAALEATGQSAKSVIAARIALEAKRLLVHTDRPIYLIAEGLGFEEATNFAKFFKREAQLTPIAFRRRSKFDLGGLLKRSAVCA